MSAQGFSVDELLVRTSDGHNIRLVEDFTYTAKSGEVITVTHGATSDGLSTPRFLWRVIPPFGVDWKAGVLHDFLYRNTQRPKAECDYLLLEALLFLGVDEMEAGEIYAGVRIGGQRSFDEDRAAQKISAA